MFIRIHIHNDLEFWVLFLEVQKEEKLNLPEKETHFVFYILSGWDGLGMGEVKSIFWR